MRSRIAGTRSYAPQKVLTNADVSKIVDTSDEWIVVMAIGAGMAWGAGVIRW